MSVLIKNLKMPTDQPARIILNPNGQCFIDHEVWFEECEAVELLSAEPKHGKWIAVEYNDGTIHTECSVCGYGRGLPPVRNYCPNCGAKMDGSKE